MAKQAAARKLQFMLNQIAADNSMLAANCTSMLEGCDLRAADLALLPVFDLGNSIAERDNEPAQLAQTVLYLRDPRLCKLLLSLLRRLPWSDGAMLQDGLALLSNLLCALGTFLCAEIRPEQLGDAYAEISKRWVSQGRLTCLAALSCVCAPSCVRNSCWLPCLCLPSCDTSLHAGSRTCAFTRY